MLCTGEAHARSTRAARLAVIWPHLLVPLTRCRRASMSSRSVAVGGVQLRGVDGRNTSRAQRRRRAAPQSIGHLDLYWAQVQRAVDRLRQRRAHGLQPRGLLVEVPGRNQTERVWSCPLELPRAARSSSARWGREAPTVPKPEGANEGASSRGGQACRCPSA